MSRELRQPPGWYVISLRPSGDHEELRRIAAQYGGGLIELSPWSVRTQDDSASRRALSDALAAPHVLVTSPAAARALRDLQPSLSTRAGQRWYAVGAGTAALLHEIGIAEVLWPRRMDSEGLLALAELQHFDNEAFGLLTAAGGRGVLSPALQARGARVLRADIYVREPAAPSRFEIARLLGFDGPLWLALSSGEALERVLAQLPETAGARLRRARVSAASARLAELARSLGFDEVEVAAGPRAQDLLAGCAALAGGDAPERAPPAS